MPARSRARCRAAIARACTSVLTAAIGTRTPRLSSSWAQPASSSSQASASSLTEISSPAGEKTSRPGPWSAVGSGGPGTGRRARDGLRERTGQAGDEVALARVERRPPFGAEEAEHGPRLAVHAQRGPQLVGEARGLHEVAVAGAPSRAVFGAHPQPGGRLLGARQVAVQVHVLDEELELPQAAARVGAPEMVHVLRARRCGGEARRGIGREPHGGVGRDEAPQPLRGGAEQRLHGSGRAGPLDQLGALVRGCGGERCHARKSVTRRGPGFNPSNAVLAARGDAHTLPACHEPIPPSASRISSIRPASRRSRSSARRSSS